MTKQSDSTTDEQHSDRNSLFIEITSREDAVASRDRAAIAVSILCIFLLITAVQYLIQGMNAKDMEIPDQGVEQAALFVAAGLNVLIILSLIAVTALIAYKNSRIAAAALLTYAIIDALVFGWSVMFGGGLGPQMLLGVILGFVARFFVVLTALNSIMGVVALHKYQAMKNS